MSKLLNSCRRCLSPKVLIVMGVIIVALLVFVPIIGIASLIAALPLIGCTVMCGAMAFFMGRDKHGK